MILVQRDDARLLQRDVQPHLLALHRARKTLRPFEHGGAESSAALIDGNGQIRQVPPITRRCERRKLSPCLLRKRHPDRRDDFAPQHPDQVRPVRKRTDSVRQVHLKRSSLRGKALHAALEQQLGDVADVFRAKGANLQRVALERVASLAGADLHRRSPRDVWNVRSPRHGVRERVRARARADVCAGARAMTSRPLKRRVAATARERRASDARGRAR